MSLLKEMRALAEEVDGALVALLKAMAANVVKDLEADYAKREEPRHGHTSVELINVLAKAFLDDQALVTYAAKKFADYEFPPYKVQSAFVMNQDEWYALIKAVMDPIHAARGKTKIPHVSFPPHDRGQDEFGKKVLPAVLKAAKRLGTMPKFPTRGPYANLGA